MSQKLYQWENCNNSNKRYDRLFVKTTKVILTRLYIVYNI